MNHREQDGEITMTDLPKHTETNSRKYVHRNDDVRRYNALRREFEPKLISPSGLQYQLACCTRDWVDWFSQDPPFNYEYLEHGPRDRNPISLEQQIELSQSFFKSRRRLKSINRDLGSSYYLKHVIQRDGKAYVCNGAVIMAAARLGLIVEPKHYGSPNAFFNVGAVLRGGWRS